MVNPVFLPPLPFADCEFDPVPPWDTNRMESVGSMTPYWKAKYRFVPTAGAARQGRCVCDAGGRRW
jgi:hypothetical protein